jgi:hypothetical protein
MSIVHGTAVLQKLSWYSARRPKCRSISSRYAVVDDRLLIRRLIILRQPVCTSPEAFMKVVTNKELYDKICSTLDATRVGDPEHFVAVCVSDPLKALVGPYYQVSRSFLFASQLGRRELISALRDYFEERYARNESHTRRDVRRPARDVGREDDVWLGCSGSQDRSHPQVVGQP